VNDLIAGLAVLAIVGVVVDGYLALRAGRESARALVSAHTHPGDRRQRDTGPPPDTPERRAHHRAPDDTRARRRDHDDPQWRYDHDDHQQPHRDDLDPPPTRDMRAIPPKDRPR
jgi:hypothetical protein